MQDVTHFILMEQVKESYIISILSQNQQQQDSSELGFEISQK